MTDRARAYYGTQHDGNYIETTLRGELKTRVRNVYGTSRYVNVQCVVRVKIRGILVEMREKRNTRKRKVILKRWKWSAKASVSEIRTPILAITYPTYAIWLV